jgi:hypothetical protein
MDEIRRKRLNRLAALGGGSGGSPSASHTLDSPGASDPMVVEGGVSPDVTPPISKKKAPESVRILCVSTGMDYR